MNLAFINNQIMLFDFDNLTNLFLVKEYRFKILKLKKYTEY